MFLSRLSPLLVAVTCFAAQPANAWPVTYEVRFDAAWNAGDFPGAFPSNAHFSPLVGGVHNGEATFWEIGELASFGIEQMAEIGATSNLIAEVDAAIAVGAASASIQGNGLSNLPRSTTLEFTVDELHPLVTLVTMVAPSPDWFVGVSGMPLRDDDGTAGQWIGRRVVELFAYDAGTEEGSQFSTGNAASAPHEPISLITDAPLGGLPPLGTFTFTVQPNGLPGDFDLDGAVDHADAAIWHAHVGAFPTGGALVVDGDADGDGLVRGRDFLIWQRHVGETLSGGDVVAIPEPVFAALAASLVLAAALFTPRLNRPTAAFDGRNK